MFVEKMIDKLLEMWKEERVEMESSLQSYRFQCSAFTLKINVFCQRLFYRYCRLTNLVQHSKDVKATRINILKWLCSFFTSFSFSRFQTFFYLSFSSLLHFNYWNYKTKKKNSSQRTEHKFHFLKKVLWNFLY